MPKLRPIGGPKASVRSVRADAEAGLLIMSTDDLLMMRADCNRLLAANISEQKRLGRVIDRINEVVESRAANGRPLEISDHAVLRYLERVKGIDVAAVRETIRDDLADSRPLCGDRIVAGPGYVAAVADRKRVTTIVFEGEPPAGTDGGADAG